MPRAAATRLFLNILIINYMYDNVHLRARLTLIPTDHREPAPPQTPADKKHSYDSFYGCDILHLNTTTTPCFKHTLRIVMSTVGRSSACAARCAPS